MKNRFAKALLFALLFVLPARGEWREVEILVQRPPRLSTLPGEAILVLEFAGNPAERLNPGTETSQFVRREIEKQAGLSALSRPGPAPPGLGLPETLKNLAGEAGAAWVVFGTARFTVQDRSGFVPDSLAGPIGGGAARRSRFSERRNYRLEVEVAFARGSDGEVLFADTWSEEVTQEASATEEIQVFFDLLSRLKDRLRQVFRAGPVRESRFIWVD